MSTKNPVLPTEQIGKMSAVLYSVEQDCFHLETMNEYVKNNIEHALSKTEFNSYQLIGITLTDVIGDDLIESVRKHQKQFEELKKEGHEHKKHHNK